MEDKRALVVLGLKPILQAGISDSLSIKVKKALCQLCIALADHGYIDAQGGCAVIEFLVKNAVAVEEISVCFERFRGIHNFDIKIYFSFLL